MVSIKNYFIEKSMLNNLFKKISFTSKNHKKPWENGNMFNIKNKILPNMLIVKKNAIIRII